MYQRPVCTRVRINRDRDTEISPSNDRGIVRANVVLTDIESERRKGGKQERKKVTRALFAAYTSHYDPEKSMLVIFRPGMLPGILIADLNVKHTATGIPVRYAWLFSVAYQNFHPLAKFA